MKFYYEITDMMTGYRFVAVSPIHFDDPQELIDGLDLGDGWSACEVSKQYYDENVEED